VEVWKGDATRVGERLSFPDKTRYLKDGQEEEKTKVLVFFSSQPNRPPGGRPQRFVPFTEDNLRLSPSVTKGQLKKALMDDKAQQDARANERGSS
jgi:hypothetical protein